MRQLEGKVAVVTGAGSGIGRAIAEALAARGVTVAAADINVATVKELVADLGGAGTAHQVDVSAETEVRALRDEVIGTHGRVDILVNNAGVAPAPTPLAEMPLTDVRRVLEINLFGAVHGSTIFLPDLLARPEAGLVNVSSYCGLVGMPRMVPYTTSKFGVRGLSEALRMELAGTPVAVTLVLPGATRTSLMTNSPLVEESRRAELQKIFDDNPGMTPEAVAAAVVRGIRSGRPRVLTGKDTRGLDAIVRLLPGRYSSLLARPMNAVLDKAFG
jgi:NAD(P)-dependent dehydrogenase (short-subunit alcohol dehydrogenase family)